MRSIEYPKMVVIHSLFFLLFSYCACNIYSQENYFDYNKLTGQEKPFRIQKINLVWEKAIKKLPPEKLKSLYTDLKYQDKEEISWKKLKAGGLDKGGLKEALIVGSFNAILQKYGLMDDFKALQDAAQVSKPYLTDFPDHSYMKFVFRDKKLNKLWLKAEQQGFSEQEMNALKEEFLHHQDKVDQYYQLINELHKKPSIDDRGNTVDQFLYQEEGEKLWKADNPHQMLREKHSEVKAGYDYLKSIVIAKYNQKEFEEPQVISLWEIANNSSFSPPELESLRSELHHFEHRIKKLKTLAAAQEMERDGFNIVDEFSRKRDKKLKEYSYKVEKTQQELTNRILQRHTEL